MNILSQPPCNDADVRSTRLYLLVCENDSIGQVIMMTLKIGAIDVLRVQPERIQCPQPELRYRALRRDTLSSW